MAPSWFPLRKQQQSPTVATGAKPPAHSEPHLDDDDDALRFLRESCEQTPIPVMEEPTVGVGVAADDAAATMFGMRPSILEFRSSRFARVNHQRQQMLQAMADAANAAVNKPLRNDDDDDSRSTTSSTRTTEKTTQDEDNDDCGVGGFTTDDDEDNDEFSAAESDDTFSVDAEDSVRISRRHRRQQRQSQHKLNTPTITLPSPSVGLNNNSAGTDSEDEYDDDDDLLLMPMPASQEVPLLEVVVEDDENDVDVILCPDPRRLPRTMVVDEDGFQISRESLIVSASRIDRAATIKAGLLFKQGFGLLNGGWKVRYVTLTSTKMTFFREEHGRKRGEIDLAQCTTKSIETMPRDSVYDGAHATVWRFAIRGKGGRRVLLSAYSETEMKDWLRCLHVALAVQGAGVGRFTDFVVPSGTFLADKNGGRMRSSANYR
uniref:PH domain-containing protein n=1 Tax=Globisporangium ultimum (strain ATCC 200006 / CBS 805.95 / DAOM BR144) TaxID=431595 RepID=K3XA68_GLOUD